MREIEVKLRAGMTANGITGEAQDRIVHSITSFALYGFPRIARGQLRAARLRQRVFEVPLPGGVHCAMLNNQPMGFYSPAMLIKDAQRHGLRVLPVDVTNRIGYAPSTEWLRSLRLGLRYARGLRQEAAKAILRARAERPFSSIDDLALRVRACARTRSTGWRRSGR